MEDRENAGIGRQNAIVTEMAKGKEIRRSKNIADLNQASNRKGKRKLKGLDTATYPHYIP